MEEVCLNSEPVFEENDEYDFEESAQMLENGRGVEETERKKEPPNPTVGLEFDSFEEAYDFYNMYARERGFGIRVSNSWFRSKRKERYRAKLSCSSAGFKKKSEANNPRPETRTGCPAMVVIKLVDPRAWRIVEVELEHNHQVSPQIKRFYKSHKRMIAAAKKAKQSDQPVTEVHTIRMYRPVVIDPGRKGGVESVDHSPKHLELREGDSHAVYNYFCRMKLIDPSFVYSMDIDDNGRLRNVFWADARSRVSYGYFCDTVAIDTTCLASKYEIPLISFVGVNHHGQSILLGCGFLGNESSECFIWMLMTWLKCMTTTGCHPKVIVTDQCMTLQTAVSEVLPKTRHCYCSRYIMQRVPEKLGGLKGYEAIISQLNKTVYCSLKISEFETSWADMINRHGLTDNRWLQTLYQDRRCWVPVYLKDVFFAGMIPIHENEGPTVFFDNIVHKHTSFKEFVDRYDLALHRKRTREVAADLESRHSAPELKTTCGFEAQLSKAYTREVFKRFQSEVEGMYSCFDTSPAGVEGAAIVTYVVKERVGKEVKCHEVLYESTRSDIRCICSLFNYKGYLCRHALSVLNYNGIEEIPSRYILPRWSKDFKRDYHSVDQESGSSGDVYNPLYRYSHLNKLALPVVEEGAKCQQHYKTALQELDALLNKLSTLDDNLV